MPECSLSAASSSPWCIWEFTCPSSSMSIKNGTNIVQYIFILFSSTALECNLCGDDVCDSHVHQVCFFHFCISSLSLVLWLACGLCGDSWLLLFCLCSLWLLWCLPNWFQTTNFIVAFSVDLNMFECWLLFVLCSINILKMIWLAFYSKMDWIVVFS